MKIPNAADLREKAKELAELEQSLAKRIIEAESKGRTSIRLDLSFNDGGLNYFGKNKEKIIQLLETNGYDVRLIPEKQLSGGFERYPEYMMIDWS